MREAVEKELLESNSSSFLLSMCTGFGKTYLALAKVRQWAEVKNNLKVLISIPRLVLEKNWREEITKFHFDDLLPNITFTTYVSLHKHAGIHWDVVILDECHHTSERCRSILKCFTVDHFIGLSATIKRDLNAYFRARFNPHVIQVAVKDAIESDVLPDPKIILIPLALDNTHVNQIITKNIKKTTNPLTIKTIGFSEKWKYKGYKGPLRILCTSKQYYDDISGLIEWYKQKGMTNAVMKNLWLHKAGERLKWLAKQKEDLVKKLLKNLKNYRALVFCQSIEQSETLGCPCVNSKVGTANLEKFNEGKIKHIASIDMLNEGLNPIDCKIGLFQMINSSQRISIQRIGRILRHKKPVLIFPYWMHTREAEIINELIKDYNQELIEVVSYAEADNIKKFL